MEMVSANGTAAPMLLRTGYAKEKLEELRKSMSFIMDNAFFACLSSKRQLELSLKLIDIGSTGDDTVGTST